MEISFPCTKCGLCCQHIDRVPELAEYDAGNGICKYLSDNLCSIYDNRPDICRVDVMYTTKYSRLFNREEFFMYNLLACKQLQTNIGLREAIQVKVDD